jgi:uncharacterized protein (DUF488 family)
MPLTVWTVGHSNRPLEVFLEILAAHRIQSVADIRTIPRSRHNPQFNASALSVSLSRAGLSYAGLKLLGGLRKPRRTSANGALRSEAMRGYADYMGTADFQRGIEELLSLAASARTAVMCAEALHDRCHRSLLSDALVCRGVRIVHLDDALTVVEHVPTPFARVVDGRPAYPARQPRLKGSRA